MDGLDRTAALRPLVLSVVAELVRAVLVLLGDVLVALAQEQELVHLRQGRLLNLSNMLAAAATLRYVTLRTNESILPPSGTTSLSASCSS